MRRFLNTIGALAIFASAGIASAQQTPQKTFVDESLSSDGIRLEETLKKASAGNARPAADLLRDAAILLQRNDPRGALRPLAAALTATPRDSALWLRYARAASAAAVNANDSYTLRDNASAAAFLAYQRATTHNDEAAALASLGEIYVARTMMRPALNAYRASLALNDVAPIRSTYADLRGKYGFRVLEEKVDSDSASPRVCFPFSEPLARKVDFTPFVAVSGSANAAVTTDDQQLCVEGLKHGERYAIVLRKGLPSAVGEDLLKAFDYNIYVRDRSPQVRFTGKNYVLPRVGQEGIPIIAVNTPRVAVDIIRVGDRNLLQAVRSSDFLAQIGSYRAKNLVNESGVKLWSGTLDVRSELNKDVVTAFPVQEAVAKMEPGVYAMVARAGEKSVTAGLPAKSDDSSDEVASEDDDSGRTATQWFVVSDIGLTAFSGQDGIHVLVRSLASAAPLSGVELRLIARNNEVLATRRSDADGHVAFDPGLARGLGGMAPNLVVAGDASADYNFLDLGQNAFDLTDRGVKGRAAVKALDAYVYAERGVYRSGETVNITTLLRDPRGASAPNLPLTLVAKRPDGVEYKRVAVTDQGLGGRAYSLALLSGAPTGTWRVQIYADPKSAPIGDTSFLVEDYVPERLDFTLKPQQPALRANAATQIDAETRWLYGAPGADLSISGDVTIQAVEGGALSDMPGYVAGITNEDFETVKTDIEAVSTDAKGKATVEFAVPDVKAPRPVEAKFILRAGEPGGRAVERTLTLPLLPDSGQIAVRKTFAELSEGAQATFDVVARAASGTPVKGNVQWSLYRVNNDYQWYNSDGRWGYERVKSTRRIADGALAVTGDTPAKLAAAVGWGTHRLDLRSDDGSLAPTSMTFDVGWSGDASADTPDLLAVTLNKPSYRVGEPLKVRIASRFAGKATVAIVSETVSALRTLDVTAGDNVVEIPVSADWGAGAYAVAIAHRPLDQAAKRMPGRALGLAWFAVDPDARKLAVALDIPAKIEPRQAFRIPVKIDGLAAGEEAYVTLAAVDIGILNLTRYEAPDASKFFFGQRLLGVDIRDLYGMLIDGMQGMRGAIRSGGDSGAAMDGNRPTQEPLSRYSGLVKVGPDGTAQVTFDIPAFNGAMRVMAVAWSKTKVGQASAEVIVRDPVVVQATLPRFLALGDQSRFHMRVDNVEGAAGDYVVDLDIHGPVTMPASALRRTIKLAAGGRSEFTIPVTAAGVGAASIDLALSGPGVKATQSFAINSQSGAADLYRRSVQTVAANGSVTLSGDLLADFVPGTGAVSLAVSAFGGIDVPALLQALDRYPYGCSEQIVSRAMPLLYVNALAATELLPADTTLNERIKDAIARVLTRQDSNGSIGLWSPGGDDLWLHAYVTDFLTRAREKNFEVSPRSFDQALDYLRNAVVNTSDFDSAKGDAIAYGAYVLARNGRPVIGDLRYLADTKLASFTSPLARAQLGAALAMLGDRARAQTVFASATDQLAAQATSRVSRPDYGSRLRDSAGLLALAAETNMDRVNITKASLTLEQEQTATRLTSTQEKAWMVLAAEALAKDAQNLALTVDGAPHQGALYRSWKDAALDGKSVTIGNAGRAPAQIVITTSGNPLAPEPAAEQGYRVERNVFAMDGKALDPATIKQNDRFVVVLKVTELEAAYARLLLVDRLPAGLEIDNPDLFDGGSVEALSFLQNRGVEATHTEYRDDRFVATFDRSGADKATFTVAYIVRAVTPGRYVQPPATIEDMYRPQRFGRTASGSLAVAEQP